MAIFEYLSFLMFVSNKISNFEQTLYCEGLFADILGVYTDNKKSELLSPLFYMIMYDI